MASTSSSTTTTLTGNNDGTQKDRSIQFILLPPLVVVAVVVFKHSTLLLGGFALAVSPLSDTEVSWCCRNVVIGEQRNNATVQSADVDLFCCRLSTLARKCRSFSLSFLSWLLSGWDFFVKYFIEEEFTFFFVYTPFYQFSGKMFLNNIHTQVFVLLLLLLFFFVFVGKLFY